jgi:hypothetical protein
MTGRGAKPEATLARKITILIYLEREAARE